VVKTEQDNKMEPLLTLICITYNHEAYIRRTLDSFLMQKTDFPFEILVHDDASTDRTADIIREYEAKYPELIRGIYQKENQYSNPACQSINEFIFPEARGRYFAHCDGDDYFTDPYKLQKQITYLETHPECVMVTHRAVWHTEGAGSESDCFYPEEEKERDYSLREIAVYGAGLFATNSFVLRREVNEQMPECFHVRHIGDYNLLIYAAICGTCHYLPDIMSVHNDGVPGSWTETIWAQAEKHMESDRAILDMLKKIDIHYEGRFHNEMEEAAARRQRYLDDYTFRYLINQGREKEAAHRYPERWKQEKRLAFRSNLAKSFPFLKRIKQGLGRFLLLTKKLEKSTKSR